MTYVQQLQPTQPAPTQLVVVTQARSPQQQQQELQKLQEQLHYQYQQQQQQQQHNDPYHHPFSSKRLPSFKLMFPTFVDHEQQKDNKLWNEPDEQQLQLQLQFQYPYQNHQNEEQQHQALTYSSNPNFSSNCTTKKIKSPQLYQQEYTSSTLVAHRNTPLEKNPTLTPTLQSERPTSSVNKTSLTSTCKTTTTTTTNTTTYPSEKNTTTFSSSPKINSKDVFDSSSLMEPYANTKTYYSHPYSRYSDHQGKLVHRHLISPTMKKIGYERRGKWTMEEEAFATAMMNYFKDGSLILEEGVSLRQYMSKMLQCHPMRITNKFSRVLGGIGHTKNKSIPPASEEEIQISRKILQTLQKSHLARLNHDRRTKNYFIY